MPAGVYARRSLSERLWEKVDKNGPCSEYRPDLGPCWLWTAQLDINGYGRIKLNGRGLPAHRAAYELTVGPVAPDLDIDHLCRVHACVRPTHLEPVTRRLNLLRGQTIIAQQLARTHCIHGHPFNEANTYRWRGDRKCRECKRANDRRRYFADRVTAARTAIGDSYAILRAAG